MRPIYFCVERSTSHQPPCSGGSLWVMEPSAKLPSVFPSTARCGPAPNPMLDWRAIAPSAQFVGEKGRTPEKKGPPLSKLPAKSETPLTARENKPFDPSVG